MSYNGWSNYESWCVKLWMDNDEGSYRFWQEETEHIWNDSEPTKYSTKKEKAVQDLSDRLKDHFEESNPLNDQASMWSDLLSAALSEVNWREIAENLLEEYEEEPELVEE